MDLIKIGLDFGTHQTKICVRRIPDEGHGEPIYDFFQFEDLDGNVSYFLPSVIQVNADDTLSYGYVDPACTKKKELPIFVEPQLETEFDVEKEAAVLYDKYCSGKNTKEEISVLKEMLNIRLNNLKDRNSKKMADSQKEYEEKLNDYNKNYYVFRYFKQSTFIGGNWKKKTLISSRNLCVLYLAYVIFLLEKHYGQNFSINMGVPTEDSKYEKMKELAVSILSSAYGLVEDVYENDINAFLNEKYDVLVGKIPHKKYSVDLKDDYQINIIPEAYASLITLTTKGKLPEGMSITADIGGGTTDLSFFTIENGKPMIYKYWSLPYGLNYIAEESGFDYADGDFYKNASSEEIDLFNFKKDEIIDHHIRDLRKKIKLETDIPVENLNDALRNRVLVYSGGGSTFPFLTKPISSFKDIRLADKTVWNEDNIIDREHVFELSILLTTAYGLSLTESDEEIKLKSLNDLFSHLPKQADWGIEEITKDQC